MTAIDLLQRLWTATLALSVALIIVAALRLPWRRGFGAEHACRLWWLPLLALIASQLPHAVTRAVIVRVPAMFIPVAPAASTPAAAATNGDWRAMLAILWLAGTCALLLLAIARQGRFLRSLRDAEREPPTPPDGFARILRARDAVTGPALVGAWRPRLVLPSDFEQRYDAHERALILAHEAMHARRRDGLTGAVATAVHALFWFHPLAWWALPRLRRDQELACDAAVLRERPRARRCYANAMLKAQFAGAVLAAGSFWPGHPIAERISMLDLPVPGPIRRAVGYATVCALGLGISATAYATAQPAVTTVAVGQASQEYQLNMHVKLESGSADMRDVRSVSSALCMGENEPALLRVRDWSVSAVATRGDENTVFVNLIVDDSRQRVGSAVLQGKFGTPLHTKGSSKDGKYNYEVDMTPREGCPARNSRNLSPPSPPPPYTLKLTLGLDGHPARLHATTCLRSGQYYEATEGGIGQLPPWHARFAVVPAADGLLEIQGQLSGGTLSGPVYPKLRTHPGQQATIEIGRQNDASAKAAADHIIKVDLTPTVGC